eukprot:Sdes_comp19695_c0_seq1m11601
MISPAFSSRGKNISSLVHRHACFSLCSPSLRWMSTFRQRFYKEVQVEQVQDGFVVKLDGRVPKTPSQKNPVVLPTRKLANLLAMEWQSQSKLIRPHTMHISALINTAIDCYSVKPREARLADIMEYFHTDTVLFRSSDPENLMKAQIEKWDPILNWFNQKYGLQATPTYSLASSVRAEDSSSLRNNLVEKLDCWHYIALENMVQVSQSMVIGTALYEDHIQVETASDLARLEAEFQAGLWGRWEGAHDVDYHDIRVKLGAASLFKSFLVDD